MLTVNPVIAEVDSSAIIHNCKILRSFIPAGCKLCAAVKCNAFGHGVEAVLPALKDAKVEMLCVASIQEAVELRELECEMPVLLLGSEFSIYGDSCKAEIANWLIENQVRITATRIMDIEYLCKAAETSGIPGIIHLMFDSGMNRMGINERLLWEIIDYAENHDAIEIEGLYTHFATADEHDKSYAQKQLERFKLFLESLRKRGKKIPIVHAANSAAIIDLPQSHFDMVRPGLSLYGYQPGKTMHNTPDLKPAMRVISFITFIKDVPKGSCIGYGCTYKATKDMTIGIIPIGYGDGYNRGLSNLGHMGINEHLVPVVGRISMDQTIIDLSSLKEQGIDVRPGQKVIVMDNDPRMENSADCLANKLATIPNEILTSLGKRIVRVSH